MNNRLAVKGNSDASAEVKTTTCYMCACRCGIRVHQRDGAMRFIDGNPEHVLIAQSVAALAAIACLALFVCTAMIYA